VMNKTRRMSEYVRCSVMKVCFGFGMVVNMRNGSVQCLVSMFRSTGDHQRRKTSLTSELRSRAHAL
jgi:hypothetical protein